MLFDTVSELQRHLKNTVSASQIDEVVRRVVRGYIDENVYQNYTPNGLYAYDRTYELIDAVEIMEKRLGTKHYSFEVAINPSSMTMDNTRSDSGQWNAHASMPPTSSDVRDLIPLWIEEGTKGGLWEREGAFYNQDAYIDLDSGKLVRTLLNALKNAGYDAHLE